MQACSTTSCLPGTEIVVDCSYGLTVKASQPDVEMVHLITLRYGGESVSVSGCLCDGAGTLYRPVFVTIPKPQSKAHAQGKPPSCGPFT